MSLVFRQAFPLSHSSKTLLVEHNEIYRQGADWLKKLALITSFVFLGGCASLTDTNWRSRNEVLRMDLKLSQQLKLVKKLINTKLTTVRPEDLEAY